MGQSPETLFGQPVHLHVRSHLQAFATMKENMEALYEQSSVGWLEKSKRKEMKTDGMHYLVAFESTTNEPLGFTAFLFDVENDEEVGYACPILVGYKTRCSTYERLQILL